MPGPGARRHSAQASGAEPCQLPVVPSRRQAPVPACPSASHDAPVALTEGSRQNTLVGLVRRPKGATITAMANAMVPQPWGCPVRSYRQEAGPGCHKRKAGRPRPRLSDRLKPSRAGATAAATLSKSAPSSSSVAFSPVRRCQYLQLSRLYLDDERRAPRDELQLTVIQVREWRIQHLRL